MSETERGGEVRVPQSLEDKRIALVERLIDAEFYKDFGESFRKPANRSALAERIVAALSLLGGDDPS